MKTVILAAFMLLSVSAFSVAPPTAYESISQTEKHIPASKVPAAVKASFNQRHPNAQDVQWEREREHGNVRYIAEFRQGGNCYEDTFLPDGTFVNQKKVGC